jgi:hypothetical protein
LPFDLLLCCASSGEQKKQHKIKIGSFYFITVNREIYGKWIVQYKKNYHKDAVAIVIVSSLCEDENEVKKVRGREAE